MSIHILDDNSLLNMFYLYRPSFLGEDENHLDRLEGGRGGWDRGRWWYHLTHVCQRWRNLILGSTFYLGLSLVCTNGTPVENMLAHSPSLPLTVDYRGKGGITPEDEEGILLALEQRHRLRHFRLSFPTQTLRKFIMAIDGEFPILEYLIVDPSTRDGTPLKIPETLQAPNLRHLMLGGFACPIRSRLHPTAAGLVTLYLLIDHESAYFQPNVLLQSISFMSQLESLVIFFSLPVPNRDVERQLTRAPITTHATLPNLRLFWFRGVSAYLEAFVCRITTPRLEMLQIQLFKQLTFSVPRLAQLMNTTENVRFDNAVFIFGDKRVVVVMFRRGAEAYAFGLSVDSWHLEWQVSSVAQISNVLNQVFSVVEHLTLEHEEHTQSSEEHNDVDRIEWRKLLRSFTNLKTLHVDHALVGDISRCLRLEDGELPLDLLPELQKLTYSGSNDGRDTFASFIDVRQNAGRPVALVRRSLVSRSTPPSPLSFEAPTITPPSDGAVNDIES